MVPAVDEHGPGLLDESRLTVDFLHHDAQFLLLTCSL